MNMEGAVEGCKLKIKALKKDRDSLESEYKKKISEGEEEASR